MMLIHKFKTREKFLFKLKITFYILKKLIQGTFLFRLSNIYFEEREQKVHFYNIFVPFYISIIKSSIYL